MSDEYVKVVTKCCCCGGTVKASYRQDYDCGKAFAEACDVCVPCFQAGCAVLTGETCNVTGKTQARLVQP